MKLIPSEIIGNEMGWRTVLGVSRNNKGRRLWHVRCRCGKEQHVQDTSIRDAYSCGCVYKTEAYRVSIRHDYCKKKDPLYKTWSSMKQRCLCETSKDYGRYGAKGITVHESWIDFSGFRDYIRDNLGDKPSPLHSLDRIDNKAGYQPGNVRWATTREQNRNQENNIYVEAFGRRRLLVEWLEEFPVRRDTFVRRVERGWSVEDALSKPISAIRMSKIKLPSTPPTIISID